jgi:hypothetical protein
MDHIENIRSCVLIKPFPCNGLYTGYTILAINGYATIYYSIIKETERKEE